LFPSEYCHPVPDSSVQKLMSTVSSEDIVMGLFNFYARHLQYYTFTRLSKANHPSLVNRPVGVNGCSSSVYLEYFKIHSPLHRNIIMTYQHTLDELVSEFHRFIVEQEFDVDLLDDIISLRTNNFGKYLQKQFLLTTIPTCSCSEFSSNDSSSDEDEEINKTVKKLKK
jgi:hypothetical protein